MGGAENQVTQVADELSRRGHKVIIAYMLEPALVRPYSDNVEVVSLGGTRSIVGMLRSYISLARLVRRTQPDVVHSHMFHANITSRLVRLVVRVPALVCTAHSNNEGGRLRMLLYRLTDRLCDVFTNVSKDAISAFERKKAAPVGRMQAVHNGIDVDRFVFDSLARNKIRSRMLLDDFRVFISIGRFHEAKDYPNLFRAFAELNRIHKNTHLLVVGDGGLRSRLEGDVKELGLQSAITLLGVRKDIPELLSAADFFVLSSAWEGFGLVVAEAMSTQRVVIATDAGGVAEVLGNEGFLVAPRDSSALGEAMQQALSMDEQAAIHLGRAARERVVSIYSLRSVVDRWERIYSLFSAA